MKGAATGPRARPLNFNTSFLIAHSQFTKDSAHFHNASPRCPLCFFFLSASLAVLPKLRGCVPLPGRFRNPRIRRGGGGGPPCLLPVSPSRPENKVPKPPEGTRNHPSRRCEEKPACGQLKTMSSRRLSLGIYAKGRVHLAEDLPETLRYIRREQGRVVGVGGGIPTFGWRVQFAPPSGIRR